MIISAATIAISDIICFGGEIDTELFSTTVFTLDRLFASI